jgi:hypothetical protein
MTLEEKTVAIREWVEEQAKLAYLDVEGGEWQEVSGHKVLSFTLFAPRGAKALYADIPRTTIDATNFALHDEWVEHPTRWRDSLRYSWIAAMVSLWELVCRPTARRNWELTLKEHGFGGDELAKAMNAFDTGARTSGPFANQEKP